MRTRIKPTPQAANLRAAESLAARLNTPAGEILDMVTAAGLEAVAAALDAQGRIMLPLSLAVTGNPIAEFPKTGTAAWPPPWKGLHPDSDAYANTMAAHLRETCRDEAEAARWYRTIRAREIPPRSQHSRELATV